MDLHQLALFIENEYGPTEGGVFDDLLEEIMPGLGEVDFLTL